MTKFTAWCMKCRSKKETEGKVSKDKNGRPRLEGKCQCGTKMFKYVKKE